MSTIIGSRALQLFIDGVDVTDEISSALIDSSPTSSGFESFTAALTGGAKDYKLKIKVRQDTDTSSLWYVIWGSAGDTLTYEFWPAGGSPLPSITNPKFSGSIVVSEPSGTLLGGDADSNAAVVQTAEVEWLCTAKPTLTTA